VFESYADRVIHVGGLGAGQTCKLINHALMTAHLKLAGDARALAAALGLDPQALLEVASVSSGSSFSLQAVLRIPIFAEGETGSGARRALVNLIKDERLLAELIRAHGIDGADLARVAAAGAELIAV
jgi:3-hydroxyisobutyrate dehydrogenase-like beta-hydroxyacid dehydrogenase